MFLVLRSMWFYQAIKIFIWNRLVIDSLIPTVFLSFHLLIKQLQLYFSMSILKQTDFGKFESLLLEGTHFFPYYFQDSVLRNEGNFFVLFVCLFIYYICNTGFNVNEKPNSRSV